jgi:hypothetical protein
MFVLTGLFETVSLDRASSCPVADEQPEKMVRWKTWSHQLQQLGDDESAARDQLAVLQKEVGLLVCPAHPQLKRIVLGEGEKRMLTDCEKLLEVLL